MQIFAKSPGGKTITVECELDWTVGDLKIKLEDMLDGLPPKDMNIIYADKQLVNDDTLEASGITKGCTVHVVFILRGRSERWNHVSVYNATEEPVGVTVLYGTRTVPVKRGFELKFNLKAGLEGGNVGGEGKMDSVEYQDGTVEEQTLVLPHQKKSIRLKDTIVENIVRMKFDMMTAGGGVATINTTSQKKGDKVLLKYHGGGAVAVEDSGKGFSGTKSSGWFPASGGGTKDPHADFVNGELCRACEFKKMGRADEATRIKNEETLAILTQRRQAAIQGSRVPDLLSSSTTVDKLAGKLDTQVQLK